MVATVNAVFASSTVVTRGCSAGCTEVSSGALGTGAKISCCSTNLCNETNIVKFSKMTCIILAIFSLVTSYV